MRQLLGIVRDDRRFAATAAFATVLVGLAIAIPTVLLPNPLFGRMIEAEWWDYALWLAAAPLIGVSVALYRQRACSVGRTAAGGLATVFAVGCPTCNALVVAALGSSGALTYFSPVQPLLGLVGLAVLIAAIRAQLRARPVPKQDTEVSRAPRGP